MPWPTERSRNNGVSIRWPDLIPSHGGAVHKRGGPERGAQTFIRWPHQKRGPLEITISWADVDGRWEPVATQVVALDLTPITALAVRRLPWGRITDAARPGPTEFGLSSKDADGEPLVYKHRVGFDQPRRGRPPKYGPEHFEEVARVYREAFAINRTPTRAVARHFETTSAAAAKWVARCRQLGLLPETSRGKARAIQHRGRNR